MDLLGQMFLVPLMSLLFTALTSNQMQNLIVGQAITGIVAFV
jgi:hypothetical protein